MVNSGSGTGGSKAVSLEAFITNNWQILTIFGVFAGFTNYLSSTENTGLVTLGFLLTFIMELEILQLLLKIKNRSFLLTAFTVLSAVFILIFASFIYSNFISNMFSGFGVAVYPMIRDNRVLLLRIIFFASILVVVLGLYRHLRRALATMHLPTSGVKKVLAQSVIAIILFAIVLTVSLTLSKHSEENLPPQTTTTSIQAEPCQYPLAQIGGACCLDSDDNGICDETQENTTNASATTTTLAPTILCSTNMDCGNQTQTRVCKNSDVYIQQTTPLCQRPGTPEARCVYRTILMGETITQEAKPLETCPRGCKDGECVD